MTTMPSGIRERSADSIVLAACCDASDAVRVAFDIEWPCLARALDPTAGPTEEVRVRVHGTLDGPHVDQLAHHVGTLRGRVIIEVLRTHGDVAPRQLADRPLRGTLVESDGWRVIACACETTDGGPLGFDLIVPRPATHRSTPPVRDPHTTGESRDGLSACGTPVHVRSDLMRWLGVPGGRYGRPAVRCRVLADRPSDA